MGLFERWGRGRDERGAGAEAGPAPDPVMPATGSADERALERYRYLLRTAPPEAIEEAHAEAFARLTPDQRRLALARLATEMPEAERATMERQGAGADALARAATRAEMRRPGALERAFGGPQAAAGGPSLGGLFAGTLLASLAGSVLGSVVAQHFLGHAPGDGAGGLNEARTATPSEATHDASTGEPLDGTDVAQADFDASSGDFGADFDGGSFDV